ncbi:unnamed protein product [Symbiodinium sp. CCMP2456]|nr:unnamed protein product [Symbiodinium sp. CCMP2456]
MRDGSFVGNQVEIVTVKALGWELSEPGQPRAVRAPDGSEELEVLRQLEFDHHRMTSGAVVRCRKSGRLLAFVKGAYDKISQIAQEPSVPPEFGDVCGCPSIFVKQLPQTTFTLWQISLPDPQYHG